MKLRGTRLKGMKLKGVKLKLLWTTMQMKKLPMVLSLPTRSRGYWIIYLASLAKKLMTRQWVARQWVARQWVARQWVARQRMLPFQKVMVVQHLCQLIKKMLLPEVVAVAAVAAMVRKTQQKRWSL